MKCLLLIGFLVLFLSPAEAQNNFSFNPTLKPGSESFKDAALKNNLTFIPITESALYSSTFLRPSDDAAFTVNTGVEKATRPQFTPGYSQPEEMMSIVSMHSTVGKLKFYCNYYFDGDGQLQDGEISISKIK